MASAAGRSQRDGLTSGEGAVANASRGRDAQAVVQHRLGRDCIGGYYYFTIPRYKLYTPKVHFEGKEAHRKHHSS